MSTSSASADPAATLAQMLLDATATRTPCEPLRTAAERLDWPTGEEQAYAVQRQVRARRVAAGDRTIGRKIGLTAASVRQQLGVFQPDYGYLWQSTCYGDGASIALSEYIHPKLEAEVAIVLGEDLHAREPTLADLIAATAYALPALEIVDSRVRQWDIRLFDTVADNASAAGFVLGADPRRLDQLSLRDARMQMRRGDDVVSSGFGHECLGHPLNAAVWLARQAARCGEPLRRGDIVMTGALGPMVPIARGDRFEAHIEGLGSVAATFE